MCPRIFKKIVSIVTRSCALWNGSFCRSIFPLLAAIPDDVNTILEPPFRVDDDDKCLRSSISALQNASRIAMLLNLRGGCRAELVAVAKKFSEPVLFCSAWKVALELVCFRFLLAKASNSARAQNSELSMRHSNLTIMKLRYKTWNRSYLLLRSPSRSSDEPLWKF